MSEIVEVHGIYIIRLLQGTTLEFEMLWQDEQTKGEIPLGTLHCRLQVRERKDSPRPLFSADSKDNTSVLTMTPTLVVVRIPATDTATWPSSAVWDSKLYNPNDPTEVYKFGRGKIEVEAAVTR